MSVIEKIYFEYIDLGFGIKPDIDEEKNGKRIHAMEELFELSLEQQDELEEFIFEICSDYQKSGFFDGFKMAFLLLFEVIGYRNAI